MKRAAWELQLDGQVIAQNDSSLLGRQVHLALVDNQATMQVDGELPVTDPVAISAVDPAVPQTRASIRLLGTGAMSCAKLTLDRDVHYSVDGILSDESGLWKKRLNAGSSPAEFAFVPVSATKP